MRSLSRFSLVGISTCVGQAAPSERGMASPGNSGRRSASRKKACGGESTKCLSMLREEVKPRPLFGPGGNQNIDRGPTLEAPTFVGYHGPHGKGGKPNMTLSGQLERALRWCQAVGCLDTNVARGIALRQTGSRDALSQASLYPRARHMGRAGVLRSEEHTSELQSQSNLVCRLLLEKKKA